MSEPSSASPSPRRLSPRQFLLPVLGLLLAAAAGWVLWYHLGGAPQDRFSVPEHILICLDAGHGGDDPGASYEGRLEKDDDLALALAVGRALEDFGSDRLEVLYTRTEDRALELQDRVDIANDAGATLFVSLHRNSGGGQGVEVWTSAEHHRPETRLARNIMDALEQAGVSRVRGVRSGTAGNAGVSYTVVGRTEMPACLVELGFIDSDTDNALLDEKLDAYAQAIADGILQMVKLK